MKVYTKTGDKGTTGLYTGERVDKDSLRVEAYGSVDEITSFLGLARSQCSDSSVKEAIFVLQKKLMSLMADLASLGEDTAYITETDIHDIETAIDSFEGKLPPLTSFLIPGNAHSSALLDVARTVTRRAERQVLRLSKVETVNSFVPVYLNRLSDFCFVLERFEDQCNTK
ncbi:MAG: cob(I)yrinic acid a,c-diamide adenosyltransferase [Sporomusaceae bacterium]|nr:cob(I)yrinic acid a,c-diamide adenosyltransferase [Sporomusaceae bacterium]